MLAGIGIGIGIGIGAAETAQTAAVTAQAPEHPRGSASGFWPPSKRPTNLVASSIAELSYTLISPTAAFG